VDKSLTLLSERHRIDVSDDRRTAESVLAIEPDEIRDVFVELAKVKRLSNGVA
jgi:hypothetical protein